MCVRRRRRRTWFRQAKYEWHTHTHISRERNSRPKIESNAGICVRDVSLVYRCRFSMRHMFSVCRTQNFSWRFFCLLQHFLDISCCSFIAYLLLSSSSSLSFAHSLQPVLIALRWKRRSHNVWLPIRIKIRLTFFFPVISSTNRWRLQWDYNCLV